MTAVTIAPKEERDAFEKYSRTKEFENSFKWAEPEAHRRGSMWAAFDAGWRACGVAQSLDKRERGRGRMMLEEVDYRWIALGVLTETSRPEELPAVIEVVLNRLEDDRYPEDARKVILQQDQFSYFNQFEDRDAPFNHYAYEGSRQPFLDMRMGVAVGFATCVSATRSFNPILPYTVTHFFSPRSMGAKRKYPSWAGFASRVFLADGSLVAEGREEVAALMEGIVGDERFFFLDEVP